MPMPFCVARGEAVVVVSAGASAVDVGAYQVVPGRDGSSRRSLEEVLACSGLPKGAAMLDAGFRRHLESMVSWHCCICQLMLLYC